MRRWCCWVSQLFLNIFMLKCHLDAGASTSALNSSNWTTLHDAIWWEVVANHLIRFSLGDRPLLARMLQKRWQESQHDLLKPSGPWDEWNRVSRKRFHPYSPFLQTIEAFHLEGEVKLKSQGQDDCLVMTFLTSTVPMLAALLPKDRFWVWKNRSGIRIDWGIAKIVKMKIIRGKMSFVARVDASGMQRKFFAFPYSPHNFGP